MKTRLATARAVCTTDTAASRRALGSGRDIYYAM
jgi:hypothetical protein